MQGLDIHLAPEINMTQLSGASKIGYPLIKRPYAKDGLPPHKDIWTPKMGYPLIKRQVQG